MVDGQAARASRLNRDDISIVGEASNFLETIKKSSELNSDLIILDLSMPDRNHVPLTKAKSLLNGAKVLAMTLGTDERVDELLNSVGAVRLLDKAELANELIPAILELGTDPVTSSNPT
jgi:DNA-binding NarL/FixJ family response regulator